MRLYWKVKVNGKWTFRAAKTRIVNYNTTVIPYDGDDIDETKVP